MPRSAWDGGLSGGSALRGPPWGIAQTSVSPSRPHSSSFPSLGWVPARLAAGGGCELGARCAVLQAGPMDDAQLRLASCTPQTRTQAPGSPACPAS